MALVLENTLVQKDIYLLKAYYKDKTSPGQFFMILPSYGSFSLRRPLSVHDSGFESVSFLYRVQGKGTYAISKLKPGDNIDMYGPLGNGFNLTDRDSAFIGGGMGVAPIYYALKQFKFLYPNRKAECYIGFSDEPFLVTEFRSLANSLTVQSGGLITDKITGGLFNYFACGPEGMMRAVYAKAGNENEVWVSLEKRMGCGVGACYSCSVKTKYGNKRVCCDGPVFQARDVFF